MYSVIQSKLSFFFIYTLQLHQNVLFNWKSLALKRRVRPIIYYDSVSETNSSGDAHAIKTILDMARLIGWETYDFPRKSSSGLPYFKDMFFDAARRIPDCLFYAYSNGDIMFNDGLLDTLDGILQVCLIRIVVFFALSDIDEASERKFEKWTVLNSAFNLVFNQELRLFDDFFARSSSSQNVLALTQMHLQTGNN